MLRRGERACGSCGHTARSQKQFSPSPRWQICCCRCARSSLTCLIPNVKPLEICLALSSGPAAGPLAACAGALGVLASAADDKPLVLLVDDFQWIDPESQRILLFVARRLATEPIAMILVVREEPGIEAPAFDLPTLRIGGLSVAECAELAKRQVSSSVPRFCVISSSGPGETRWR
jgi:hypothetical protein